MFVITGAGDGLEKAQIDYINTELNRNDIVVATNMPGAPCGTKCRKLHSGEWYDASGGWRVPEFVCA